MSLSAVVGSAIGALVNLIVVLYAKRLLRLHRERVELLLTGVEAIPQKGLRMVNLREYRKGIAAGTGGLLGGLLVYVETNDLEPVIGPLVAPAYRPLVGWLAGAVVLTVSVIIARNDPKAPSEPAATLPEPAPPALGSSSAVDEPEPVGTAPASSAAAAPAPAIPATAADDVVQAPTTGPWWRGVAPGDPQAATSRIQLLPPPSTGDYH